MYLATGQSNAMCLVLWPTAVGAFSFCFLASKSCANWECIATEEPHKSLDFKGCEGGQIFLSHFLQIDSIVLNTFIRLYFIYAVPKHLGFI
jgi:hypothetical protein